MTQPRNEAAETFERGYSRFGPAAIVAGALLAYLIADGLWWGIPIVALAATAYALLKVRITLASTRWINRRSKE